MVKKKSRKKPTKRKSKKKTTQLPLIDPPSNADAYSMRQWQNHFKKIYFKQNKIIKKKGFQNNQAAFIRGYIMFNITKDLGDLAESIRESNRDNTKRYIGSMFAWVSALANEIDFDLENAIWDKYPGFCPYCHKESDCDDAWWTTTQKKKDKDPKPKILSDHTPLPRPQSLIGWIENWNTMYGNKYRTAMETHNIMFKLFEENAEILSELDKIKSNKVPRSKKLQREVADFVSWMFAIVIKFDNSFPKEELPKILFGKFGKGCKKCKNRECKCKIKWLK